MSSLVFSASNRRSAQSKLFDREHILQAIRGVLKPHGISL